MSRKPVAEMRLVTHTNVSSLLYTLSHMVILERRLWQRATIALLATEGKSNIYIANRVGLHYNNVSIWRKRFAEALDYLEDIAENASDYLWEALLDLLCDNPGRGRRKKYSDEDAALVIKMACNSPADYGLVRSHWSLNALHTAMMMNPACAPATIPSIATIFRMLIGCNLKPWKNRYWLHSKDKDEDPIGYKVKVKEIIGLYHTAHFIRQFNGESDTRIISTDEMTGIQALEHKYPDKLPRPGKIASRDFEYIRNGTTSLIAFLDVVSGKVLCPYLNSQRTSEDFTKALRNLIETDPDKYWIIIADNLNTHISEELIRMIAEKCGIPEELGVKGKCGVLENIQTRTAFLTDRRHRIRMVFTPKHCSWLNQIEIWFGIINKQLLRRTSYTSVSKLEDSIRKYIEQYNDMFAKPLCWTYNTTPIGD